MIATRAFFDGHRRVTEWRWEPWTVYGGFRCARVRWVLEREGWDQIVDVIAGELFASEASCSAACAAMNG
jgi:hypothetical protein